MSDDTGLEKSQTASGRRKSTLVGVHCSAKMAAAIDEYIADQYDLMLRPEAIRKILTEWLGAHGYLGKNSNGLTAEEKAHE